MKKVFIILTILIQNYVVAQNKTNLNILESLEFEDEVKSDSIPSIYTSKTGNTAIIRPGKNEIYFDIFDNNLIRKYSKSVETERKENYLGDIFYNNEIKVFTETMPKKDIKILSCYILNLDNKSTKKIELSQTEVDKKLSLYSNEKGVDFALSPNSKFFTLATYTIHRGEIYFQISVFDADTYELIFEKQTVRNENSFYSIIDIQIDNEQNVFIFGKSFFDKDNPQLRSDETYYYLMEKFSKSDYSKLNINFADKYVKTLKPALFNNSYNLYGFYSDKDFSQIKGVCNISIDLKTLTVGKTNFQDLPEKVFTDMFGSKRTERKKDKELSNFNIDHILIDSQNSVYLIAEEFYITTTTTGSPYGGSANIPHFDDIIIIKFQENGDIDWGRSIYKRDNRPSYNAFLKSGELHIILNSGKDLKQLDEGRTKTKKGLFESSALYDFKYTIGGNENIYKIQENKDNTYYLPNYGKYADEKFIMMNDSKQQRKFMLLE